MELLQVRIDEKTKKEAAELFDSLGMDLSSAIRVFLRKSIRVGGLPFAVSKYDDDVSASILALERMRTLSENNGNSEMALDEINEEIALARKKRKAKQNNME